MRSSPRLRYEPLAISHLDAFHSLVQDAHIRQYMMDGEVFPREWSEARVRDSEHLVLRRGVGLRLAFEVATHELVGFCGFLEFASMSAEPQLVYALLDRFTGRGYATEMAGASIEDARLNAGFSEIVAGVDEVNAASVRVLEKLGFTRHQTMQGAFGNMFTYKLVP